MAWTAPMTAVTNNAWTAAQFNTHVRDNFLETMPGKATTAGRYFCSTGANAIAERTFGSATVATSETLAVSASYGALATPGPAVTVTTGTRAMVWWASAFWNNTSTSSFALSSVAVSGASTVASSDDVSLFCRGSASAGSGDAVRLSTGHLFTGLTAGSNTFTMQYKALSQQGAWQDRELVVMAL